MALCKVMIIGNLGSDPEMRYTPNGRAVTQFNVAVNQSTKNQQTGEWIEETDWFRVSVWGDRAERMAESLRKGNKVFVEGRFKTREFEGRDGQKRTALEITGRQHRQPRTPPARGGRQLRWSVGQGYGTGQTVPRRVRPASPNRATSTTFPSDLTRRT